MGKAARRAGRAKQSRGPAAPALNPSGPADQIDEPSAPSRLDAAAGTAPKGTVPHVANVFTLRGVADAVADLEHSRASLDQSVSAARADGHSWAAIGSVLGITRQSAQQRFGR